MSAPTLRVERVSKRFGTVEALRDVSLSVHAGQVTCGAEISSSGT